MLRKLFASALAFAAAAFVVFPPVFVAYAQTLDAAHVMGFACAHSELCAYLLTAFGAGSIVAWFKKYLPAPVAHLANLFGLNWPELIPVAKALLSAVRTPAVPPTAIVVLTVGLGLTLALSACSSKQVANIQATNQAIQQTMVTLQPVASDAACVAQALANSTTQAASLLASSGTLKGGAAQTAQQVALDSATSSKIVGTYCNGLPQGAPLPTPVAVTGQTQTVNGVTVPVPAASPSTAASSS